MFGNRRANPTSSTKAAARYLDTMLIGTPKELGSTFGWETGVARQTLDALVTRRRAERDGPAYRLSSAAR